MNQELKSDKVFISYSWSSQEHEKWVIELAERLMNDGVEVVLDKWDSVEGQNLNAFMQRSVNDSTIKKVLVICDRIYTEKADEFKGGVGTETVIISNEVYQNVEQTKFIAIVAERDEHGSEFIPTYLKGTKYIDMSTQQSFEDGYRKLIRNLYGKHEYIKPSLGKAPVFLLEDEKKNSLNSKNSLRNFKYKVEKNPRNIGVFSIDFLEDLKNDYVTLSLKSPKKEELLDQILKGLHDSIELRDFYLEFLELYIRESEVVEDYILIEFFESIYPLIKTREEGNSYFELQFDHMKVFITELMIYTIGLLYKFKKYSAIKELVGNHYIVKDYIGRDIDGGIGIFRFYPELIESTKLPHHKQKYISNTGQLIIERANYKGISSNDLIQADFIIYFLSFIYKKNDSYTSWFPPTIPYFSIDKIQFISRLKSKRFFENCRVMFNDISVEEFRKIIEEFNGNLSQQSRFGSGMYIRSLFGNKDEIAKY